MNYEELAIYYANAVDYYTGLLDEIAKVFGPDAYVSDDGSVQDSPLRAKMPDLVREQARQLAAARAAADAALGVVEAARGRTGPCVGGE
jgi:hypothetical protein